MRHPFVILRRDDDFLKNSYRLPDPGIHKSDKQIEREVSMQETLEEYLRAKGELDELREQYGIEPKEKEGKISRLISNFFDRREQREKVCLNKKKHMLLAIFLGWAGAHRFHAKQYLLGLVYLLLCWSGFSMAMTVVDIFILIPMQPDENGNILI